MIYSTGASFRHALEDRLRLQSLQTGAPLVRLRKLVVFDRFLVQAPMTCSGLLSTDFGSGLSGRAVAEHPSSP